MSLPLVLSSDQGLNLLQTKWAAQLNPVLSLPILDGNLIEGIALINGTTVINHLLARLQRGWVITDINAGAAVYRSAPYNSSTLTLTSGASCTISLWVF